MALWNPQQPRVGNPMNPGVNHGDPYNLGNNNPGVTHGDPRFTYNQWGQRTGGGTTNIGDPATRWGQPTGGVEPPYTPPGTPTGGVEPPVTPPTIIGDPAGRFGGMGSSGSTRIGDPSQRRPQGTGYPNTGLGNYTPTTAPGVNQTFQASAADTGNPAARGGTPPPSTGNPGENGYGGRTPTGDGHTYNPLDYNDPNARFAAWAAAGYPTKDKYGNALDTRGMIIQYGFNDQDKARGVPGAQSTQWYGPNNATYTPSTGQYGVGTPPPGGAGAPPPMGVATLNPASRYAGAVPDTTTTSPVGRGAPPPPPPPPGGGNVTNPAARFGNEANAAANSAAVGNVGVPKSGQGNPAGATTTQDGPTGNNPENHNVNDPDYFVNRLTNNGQLPPNGSAGQNANNNIAQQLFSPSPNPPPVNPLLGRWVQDNTSEAGQGSWHFEGSDAYKALLGRGMTQIANDDGSVPRDGRILNWSLVTYDPVFGMVTPISNVHMPYDHGDETFAVFAAVLGGAVASHIIATGGGLGAGGAGEFVGPPDPAGGTPPGGGTGPSPGDYGVDVTNNSTIPGNGVEPPPPPPPGAGTTPPPPPPPGGGSSFFNNPVGRGLIGAGVSAGVNTVLNPGGRPTGTGNPGTGTPDPNGNPLGRGISDAINWNIDRNDINNYHNQVNDYVNRGDYNSANRPGMLARYNDFLLHPENALKDPGFVAMKDRNLSDLSRQYNARGLAISGNEMGGLQARGDELNYKHLGEQEAELRAGIGLGDPAGMARAGINSLSTEYQMRSNHNATTGGLVNRIVGAAGNFLRGVASQVFNGKSVEQWLGELSNGMSWQDAPPEVQAILNQAAQQNGQTADQFVHDYFTNYDPNNSQYPPMPDIPDGDPASGEGDWSWLWGD